MTQQQILEVEVAETQAELRELCRDRNDIIAGCLDGDIERVESLIAECTEWLRYARRKLAKHNA